MICASWRSVRHLCEGGQAMAMKDKAMYSVELDKHMMAFLEDMVKQYDLPDTSKAMRILITYALDPETDRDRIFSDVRCFDCE
jgi:metal-responsive CopG/Arc/MetJ family transcriptional regulator